MTIATTGFYLTPMTPRAAARGGQRQAAPVHLATAEHRH